MWLFAGALLAWLGLLMLLWPQAVFTFTEGWKSDSPGQPSGLYLLSTRIGGAAMLAVGVLSVILHFMS